MEFTQGYINQKISEALAEYRAEAAADMESIRNETGLSEGETDWKAEAERLQNELAGIQSEVKTNRAKVEMIGEGYSEDQADYFSKYVAEGSVTVEQIKKASPPKKNVDPASAKYRKKRGVWNPFS